MGLSEALGAWTLENLYVVSLNQPGLKKNSSEDTSSYLIGKSKLSIFSSKFIVTEWLSVHLEIVSSPYYSALYDA